MYEPSPAIVTFVTTPAPSVSTTQSGEDTAPHEIVIAEGSHSVNGSTLSEVPASFVTTLIDWTVFHGPVVTSGTTTGGATTVGVYVAETT